MLDTPGFVTPVLGAKRHSKKFMVHIPDWDFNRIWYAAPILRSIWSLRQPSHFSMWDSTEGFTSRRHSRNVVSVVGFSEDRCKVRAMFRLHRLAPFSNARR